MNTSPTVRSARICPARFTTRSSRTGWSAHATKDTFQLMTARFCRVPHPARCHALLSDAMAEIWSQREYSYDTPRRNHRDRWGHGADCDPAYHPNVVADDDAGGLSIRTRRTHPACGGPFWNDFRGLRRTVLVHSKNRYQCSPPAAEGIERAV